MIKIVKSKEIIKDVECWKMASGTYYPWYHTFDSGSKLNMKKKSVIYKVNDWNSQQARIYASKLRFWA